jgi:hypothetical protein
MGRFPTRRPAGTEPLERRVLLAAISGRVVYDYDADAVADPGEVGAADFTVYADINNNLAPDAGEPSSITDATGSYSLDTGSATGLLPVRVVARTGWGFSAPTSGVQSVTVASPGETHSGVDFLASDRSVFTGRVFNDLDADGVVDATDPPLAGWTVFADLDHDHTIDPGEPTTQSGADGVYALNLPGAGPDPNHRHYHLVQILPDGWRRTAPAFSDLYTVITRPAVVFRNLNYGARAAASVAGRRIFYNNSAYDGGSPAADTRDDAAIAPDKEVLLPGSTATAANVTNYTRGINGVMVDVAGLWGDVTPADFTVRVGTGGDPSTWAAGPAPNVCSCRRGQGAGGSDRVTLYWTDGAIRNTWVLITVNATDRTGLAAPEVFYVGNLVGDVVGAPPRVDAADLFAVRMGRTQTADLSNPLDLNRDGRVDVLDEMAVRANLSRTLDLITAPGAPAGTVTALSAPTRRGPWRPTLGVL